MKTEEEIQMIINRLEMQCVEQMELHKEQEAEIAGDHMTPSGLRHAALRMDESYIARKIYYGRMMQLREILA